MEELLNHLINANRHFIDKGNVADYIPALKSSDPKEIGICLIDKNNKVYKAGSFNRKFTIQSISKVLVLLLAIEDNGVDYVFHRVGYEASEDPFNSIYRLDLPHINKPSNPMINSGAIVTTSLIKGEGEDKINRILELIRNITENRDINYNKDVFESEKTTGHKNKSMAYLMKSRGMIEGDIDNILDTYFKQCAIEIDVVDLARIGIFIANGCNTLTTNYKLGNREIAILLTSIMNSSGMYDFSGEYATKVGIPSKSGVAGGLMGTLPGKMGIGIYNPVLDRRGNSIVGYNIMKDLSRELSLNIYGMGG